MTSDKGPTQRVVVDGSNLATEGRSLPSLAQLDEAVRAFREEHVDDDIIVVVDASFSYRIDESERQILEEAEEAGEIVSPPAGAIGRGDGFLLRIADRTGAVVLSNDSFQEFHGEYKWLFEEGRLIGGKPVPGVGWIFTPRTPVRGPKSRVAVRDAERARRRTTKKVDEPVVAEAIAEATAEAIEPDAPGRTKRGRRRGPATSSPDAVNEPLPFITFIANHRLGSEVEGEVDSFTSHGAFVNAGGARCYAPVVGLGDPPPRSAKEVLTRGETLTFIVQALDPPRRGIELALPGLARPAGRPTQETVEAEIDELEIAPASAGRRRAAALAVAEGLGATAADADAGAASPRRRTRKKAATGASDGAAVAEGTTVALGDEPAMKRTSTRAAASRPTPVEGAPAEPAAASTGGDVEAKAAARPAKRARKAKAAAPVQESAVPASSEAVAEAKAAAPARSGPRRSTIKKAATTAGAPSRTAPRAPSTGRPRRAKAPVEDQPATAPAADSVSVEPSRSAAKVSKATAKSAKSARTAKKAAAPAPPIETFSAMATEGPGPATASEPRSDPATDPAPSPGPDAVSAPAKATGPTRAAKGAAVGAVTAAKAPSATKAAKSLAATKASKAPAAARTTKAPAATAKTTKTTKTATATKATKTAKATKATKTAKAT